MIECKLCGYKSKCRIIEHLVKIHKYNIEEYKLKYGPVITDEYKKAVSDRAVEKWKNEDYRNKTNKARNNSWTDDKRKKQSEITKQSYKNGFKNWSLGLTKETDIRVKNIGEFNKKNLTGRTKENYEYLKKHSIIMKHRLKEYWSEDGILKKYFENSTNFSNWRDKISKTISEKYINGELEPAYKYCKSGYYKNIYYASSLELKSMEWFDSDKNIKSWRKNFDIVKYFDKNGKIKRYLPDFEITTINDITIIVETKGYPDENLNEKVYAASNKYKYYFVCYSVEEVKIKIYEVINNTENNKI